MDLIYMVLSLITFAKFLCEAYKFDVWKIKHYLSHCNTHF